MSVEGEDTYVRDGVNIRLVARRQRLVLWLVLGVFVGYVLQFTLMPLLVGWGPPELTFLLVYLAYLLVRLAVVVGAVMLMRALGTNIVLLVLAALLMFLPLINLIILLMENRRAIKLLRKAGLRVGIMGVRDDEVVRRLAPHLCRECGYDLTGNVSGICPECGTRIPQTMPLVVPRV